MKSPYPAKIHGYAFGYVYQPKSLSLYNFNPIPRNLTRLQVCTTPGRDQWLVSLFQIW